MEEYSNENNIISLDQENRGEGAIKFAYEQGSQYIRYKTKDGVYEKKKAPRKLSFECYRCGFTSLLKKLCCGLFQD
jgi:hypothetical protein